MSERCDEVWPSGKAVGLILKCERDKGHGRRLWHQYTNEKGQRLQWEHAKKK